MKLLISAYACAPNRGSEHAVGWNWVTEAKRLGHEVWALVAPNHRAAIDRAGAERPELRDIHWVFPEVRFWALQQGIEPEWERTYNLLWQRAALRHARALHRTVQFDLVHHLTWGGVRAPTFLGGLHVPLVVGPLGGGETSPRALRDGFGFKSKALETLRDISTATIAVNPMVRGGLNKASLLVVKTEETYRVLTPAMRRKSINFLELGLDAADIGEPRNTRQNAPRLLFAGRLLYWKGVHLALRAFAQFSQRMPDARLTIVGKGSEERRLRADAAAYHVEDKVDFISWLPQHQLFDLYANHDLLVFPSLHDSSGNVVLEALSHGLPVMCLDLGGPRYLVTPQCGVIIRTADLDTEQVAAAMAEEMHALFTSPTRLTEFSAGAIARAKEFILSKRVASFYENALAFIAQSEARKMQGGSPALVTAKR